jgi:hypothetical protein
LMAARCPTAGGEPGASMPLRQCQRPRQRRRQSVRRKAGLALDVAQLKAAGGVPGGAQSPRLTWSHARARSLFLLAPGDVGRSLFQRLALAAESAGASSAVAAGARLRRLARASAARAAAKARPAAA